jgi:hypothetical protein
MSGVSHPLDSKRHERYSSANIIINDVLAVLQVAGFDLNSPSPFSLRKEEVTRKTLSGKTLSGKTLAVFRETSSW